MERDDIIRITKEAGFELDCCSLEWHSRIRRFAALVAAHEREATAKECETLLPSKRIFDQRYYEAIEDCVATIRARGEA